MPALSAAEPATADAHSSPAPNSNPPLNVSGEASARVMLANVYRGGVDLSAYWVSEKLDGVRGYWDGQHLFTRTGQRIYPPAGFTNGWPAQPMDGELWAGRGQFNAAVSAVRQQTPSVAAWENMRFMVFDLPAEAGVFNQRLAVLHALLAGENAPAQLGVVAQFKVSDERALQQLLRRTVKAGGEGLMLHRGDSVYRALRSDDLLKVKLYDDAEAVVVAHTEGRGKYRGMVGALVVEMPSGLRFKLGTGFRDEQRQHPPAVGSTVTYRFRGVNPSGVPRFASFVRVREAGY